MLCEKSVPLIPEVFPHVCLLENTIRMQPRVHMIMGSTWPAGVIGSLTWRDRFGSYITGHHRGTPPLHFIKTSCYEGIPVGLGTSCLWPRFSTNMWPMPMTNCTALDRNPSLQIEILWTLRACCLDIVVESKRWDQKLDDLEWLLGLLQFSDPSLY